jgi:hypothetical protein
VKEGFNKNVIGSALSKIPLIGGLLGGLFGTKTTVLASGLYAWLAVARATSSAAASTRPITATCSARRSSWASRTSSKTSTRFAGADGALETQFALLLRSFNDAILAAAGPLGAATVRHPEPAEQLRRQHRQDRSEGPDRASRSRTS